MSVFVSSLHAHCAVSEPANLNDDQHTSSGLALTLESWLWSLSLLHCWLRLQWLVCSWSDFGRSATTGRFVELHSCVGGPSFDLGMLLPPNIPQEQLRCVYIISMMRFLSAVLLSSTLTTSTQCSSILVPFCPFHQASEHGHTQVSLRSSSGMLFEDNLTLILLFPSIVYWLSRLRTPFA